MVKLTVGAVLSLSPVLLAPGLAAGCNDQPPKSHGPPGAPPTPVVGRLNHHIVHEGSAVIDSRRHPGVFWTVGDSGNPPELFAFHRDGTILAQLRVGAPNVDWECVSADEDGHLYIGDTGNNERERTEVVVHRVDEPDPTRAAPGGADATVPVTASWRLKFPGKPFDGESLIVSGGRGYVISKVQHRKLAGLYRFDLSAEAATGVQTLHLVCDLPVAEPVTDAALSRDGNRLAVQTNSGPYLFEGLGGDVARAGAILPQHLPYCGTADLNIEGVCFVDDGLLATSEQGRILLFGLNTK